MEKIRIGQSELKAAAVALGTWAIGGGPQWGDNDDNESIRAIQAAVDCGVELIDTAPAYGFGHSEEIVGKALAGRRDKVVLSTKCGLWWKDGRGSMLSAVVDGKKIMRCLQPETIREEVEMSLRRLNTDYIDILHTHWQEAGAASPSAPAEGESQIKYDPPTPVAVTMETLMNLKEEGKIRAVGVSNCSVEIMREYIDAGVLDANQPRFSMLDRSIENEILPFCLENKISVLSYSPLEQGILTGKFKMDTELKEGTYRNRISWYHPENREKVLQMLESWSALTDKYNCTIAQLVIAWTAAKEGISFVLCGARKPAQAEENASALNIKLSKDDFDFIDSASRALNAETMI